MLPFLLWALAYALACWYFVPRLGQVSRAQADARSVMTGRITDAYTNIATVKLFSHTRREAEFARAAMEDFKLTGYAQMRLVSQFEVVNHVLVVALILGACGSALWLWSLGQVGAGAVAAVTAMALRLSGMSHWVMWEMTSLFESVGTIQDGINTLSRPRAVVDAPDARPLEVTQRRGALRGRELCYRDGGAPVIDHLQPGHPPGREDRPDRPLGRRQVHAGEPAAALSRRAGRAHPDRRAGHRPRHAGQPAPAHRHGDARHLAAAPRHARQHPLRPPRCQRGRTAHRRRARPGARVHRHPDRPAGPHAATTPRWASAA
jgi:hypothetical protein